MSIFAVTWLFVALGTFGLSGSTQAKTTLSAGTTVIVSVSGVRSEEGHLLSTLCADRPTFMRGCMTFAHSDPAHAGSVTVVFRNVKPGTYAFFALHDLDDSRAVKIPPDGWAFGNDANFPPTFDAASFTVGGEEVQIHATMRYLGTSSGVTPPGTTQSPASLAASASPFSDLNSALVNDEGLVAEFYTPSDHQRHPAVIVVSGSDGSLRVARNLGANFARHGYAVLVLAYWGQPPLPPSLEGIRLEYFKGAIDWLGRQASVDPHHIGMIGWSRGAEVALLVAAHYPEIRAVVGVSPTSMVWPGLPRKPAWTLGGKPLSNIPLKQPEDGTSGSMRELFIPGIEHTSSYPEAVIPVEHINGPILLLSGSEDRIWPASKMAEQIVSRLRQSRFPFPYTHIEYSGAGHAVFVGGITDIGHIGDNIQLFGGTVEANRSAWVRSWPTVVEFFDKALR
jgi:dienelactone hydrolase/uncharacterized protein (DUF2141 family)